VLLRWPITNKLLADLQAVVLTTWQGMPQQDKVGSLYKLDTSLNQKLMALTVTYVMVWIQLVPCTNTLIARFDRTENPGVTEIVGVFGAKYPGVSMTDPFCAVSRN